MYSSEQRKLLTLACELEAKSPSSLYLVGGLVRDLFLGHDIEDKDIDFLVDGDAEEFAQSVVGITGGKLERYPQFLTAKIVSPDIFTSIKEIDFASAREETYEHPGALPCVRQSSLEHDLQRRDFTVNAIALPISEAHKQRDELLQVAIDPFDGRSDLQQGLIRVLHDESFRDDPTRLFRACRYLARMQGTLAEETQELFREAIKANAIHLLSAFRQFREIDKIFQEPGVLSILDWMVTLELYDQCELLSTVSPGALRDGVGALPEGRVGSESIFVLLFRLTSDMGELTQAFRNANVSKKKIERFKELGLAK